MQRELFSLRTWTQGDLFCKILFHDLVNLLHSVINRIKFANKCLHVSDFLIMQNHHQAMQLQYNAVNSSHLVIQHSRDQNIYFEISGN